MKKSGVCFLMAISYLLFGQVLNAQTILASKLAHDIKILKDIDSHKPSKGTLIPKNIKARLGATHVGGKYYFTNEPYIIEGAKKLYSLGFGVCKLWFYKDVSGYKYNSDWNLPKNISLKDLAQHPYYKAAFDVPFSTFLLSTSGSGIRDILNVTAEGLKKEELEYYELTKYLLQEYKERNVEFILHNWEGDWIVRGGVEREAQWGRVSPPADVDQRFLSMRKVFTARQNGVNKARDEVKNSQCKVYHAIEVNKVIDAIYGVPTLATEVLPYVEVDMVSWSAYDATDFDKSGLDLYKGIEFLKSKIKPTNYIKKPVVFLGEIGVPEIATKEQPQEFKERWDTYLAVCLAQKIPYIVHWELFCNETAKGVEKINQPQSTKSNTDLNGFWLVKPDGKIGYAMEYFDKVLKNAGSKISDIN